MNYRIAVGEKAAKSNYVDTLPMTVVVDRKGKIREVIERGRESQR